MIKTVPVVSWLGSPPGELLLIAILTAAYWALQTTVVKNQFLAVWDAPISSWMVSRTTPASLRLFSWITELGKYPLVRMMAFLLAIGLLLLGDWRRAILLIALVAITVYLSRFLKRFVPRKRPNFPQNYLYEVDTTFPSGHTLLSTAFYLMLAYLCWVYGAGTWLGWTGAICFVVLVFLIGFSRIYLGLHYLTDVLGGWLLGSAFFLFVVAAGEWIFFQAGLL